MRMPFGWLPLPARCAAMIGIVLLLGIPAAESRAGAGTSPRVLPDGQLPSDARLGPLKDLDGYFPFFVPATADGWTPRAAQIRRRILVSVGLWPLPTKTPLNAVIHGRLEQPEYTIEKVYFEALPGFFVTGNLYRPAGATGKCPAVLCPHGHWAEGRFYDCGREDVRKQIVEGAERFEDGGRSPLQSRCVQLARMGCVVFHWDMIGYADSQQIPASIAHRFAKQRPEMNDPEHWGLFSPQAESRFQSVMGLQTFSAIRALDFVLSLSDVDSRRVGITGASGGGTQTFILSAIDPRLAWSFPAVMVSTAMQGGCTCENACCLRIGTGNVEFAALFAPRPLGMTAANDWTKEMETKGLPELKRLFSLLGAEQHVMLKPLVHFGHNYNYVSRASMYSWLNRYFKLGLTDPIVEEDYHRYSPAELSVWDAEHPRPAGGPEFERKLLQWWTQDLQRQLNALLPTDAASLERYRQVVGGGVDTLIGRALPAAAAVELQVVGQTPRSGYQEVTALINHRITGADTIPLSNEGLEAKVQEQLPLVALIPEQARSRVCVWVSPEGKAALFDAEGQPIAAVRKLLDNGIVVCGADLFLQGEFLADGKPVERTRRVANERESAAYTFGYNSTVFAQRVHDLLTIVAALQAYESPPEEIDILGSAGAGPWVAAARAVLGPAVTRAVVDTGGFRFAQVRDLHDPQFLPGGARYHDLPGMLALGAPGTLWLAGEGEAAPEPVQAAYRAAGQPDRLVIYSQPEPVPAAVQWLVSQ